VQPFGSFVSQSARSEEHAVMMETKGGAHVIKETLNTTGLGDVEMSRSCKGGSLMSNENVATTTEEAQQKFEGLKFNQWEISTMMEAMENGKYHPALWRWLHEALTRSDGRKD
jgi:hypothetical protein